MPIVSLLPWQNTVALELVTGDKEFKQVRAGGKNSLDLGRQKVSVMLRDQEIKAADLAET